MKKNSKYLIIIMIFIALIVAICFVPIRASKLIPAIEELVEKDFGVKVHIERLVLRLGPSLKVKAPIVHLMYEDGQKFAQFDGAKFYIPWSSLIKNKPIAKYIQAKKLTVRLTSEDKFLPNIINGLSDKDFRDIPSLKLKEYNLSYSNKADNEVYSLIGTALDLEKNTAYKNFKVRTKGNLGINNKNYISYDATVLPNIENFQLNKDFSLIKVFNQIKDLDFHSDIIADIKLYNNSEKQIQASGFINIDNISVLDLEKKTPKSFLYLTLWGDKASVLSNIYTSLSHKVYIEGMVNNSKKPVIDLKVKTDDININDLYKKIRIFSDFSYFRDIQSIAGTLNANFSLKGDLNKIKSNGYLKINNASINTNGIQINKINSEIDFSNNTINILKSVGYVNGAPIILQGSISKNIDVELLMNKVELKYVLPSNLGIKDGIASIIAHFSGTFDKFVHKENINIENLNINNEKFNVNIDSFKFDSNKSNVAYINALSCSTLETELIKIPSIRAVIDSNTIKIPESDIYMPNSKITLKGDVVNFLNKDINYIFNLYGFVNSKDFTRFANYSTRFPVKLLLNGNLISHNINYQMLFEKTDILDEPTLLNLISKYENNSLKIEDLSLLSFSGSLSNDFKNNIKGNKKLLITGLVENLNKPLFKNVRVFIPQQFNFNVFDTLAQIKGDIFINGEPIKPEIIGQISINNLFNQLMQMSLSNASIDFNKNNFIFNAPQIKISDSSMGLNALISTDFTNGILVKNLNIKSKYINTDTFLMYKDSPVIKDCPIKIINGKLYSERVLANIYGTPLYLSAFVGDMLLENELLTLKDISSELFNGKLSGAIKYNLRDEHYDLDIMSRGVSAEPIFNIVSTRKDSISGTMDFDAKLKGELTSKQSLNGNIKFIVNNGQMSTLGKLEHLLYAQNVIADNMLRTSLSVVTKAITLKNTGLFKYLRGDIDLENGIANINFLQSQGPLMALFIKGQYNPLNDYAKLVVLGRLSDEVIAGLGAFGDFSLNKLMIMLTGEDTKYNINVEDFEKIPQLPVKNTKEFRTIINGVIDKTNSVVLFNWISYSQKSLKQKEVLMNNVKLPEFVEALPY